MKIHIKTNINLISGITIMLIVNKMIKIKIKIKEIIIVIQIIMKTTPIVNNHITKNHNIIIMNLHKMKITNTIMIQIINIQTKDNKKEVQKVNKMM